MLLYWRRAMGVEGLDGFQPPGLSLLALLLRPDDRLPIRRQNQPCAGIGDLDPVAAGLIDVEEEGLLDRVLVRASLDVDPILEENIRSPQNILAAVECVSEMVETAGRSGMIARIGEVVALVRDRHPHRRFRAVVEHDLFGQPATQIFFEEYPVRLDIDSQTIEVIEAAHVDAARREALRLILQGRLPFGRRLVPFGLVIELDDMAIRVSAAKCRTMAEIAIGPADIE